MTIQDIIEYAQENNFNLEGMRFKIGENTDEPRYFGIYFDQQWYVYRTKSDGSKVFYYEGNSEDEACNIVLDHIDEQIDRREIATTNHIRKNKRRTLLVIVVIMIIAGVVLYKALQKPVHHDGYYVDGDQIYYVQDHEIYYFNQSWFPLNQVVSDEWYQDYYYGSNYEFENIEDEFYYSSYYDGDDVYYDSGEEDDYDSNNENTGE